MLDVALVESTVFGVERIVRIHLNPERSLPDVVAVPDRPGAQEEHPEVLAFAVTFNVSVERVVYRCYSMTHAYKYQAFGLNPSNPENGLGF